MPVVSITLNDDEYRALKQFSKQSHVPMSKALKKMLSSQNSKMNMGSMFLTLNTKKHYPLMKSSKILA